MDELGWEKLELRRAEKQRAAEALGAEMDAAIEHEQRMQREADERRQQENPRPPSMFSLTGDPTTTFTTRDLERERSTFSEPKDDDKPRTLLARLRRAVFA